MKGIILAGGAGTRLFPISQLYSKQLMYVYDKPMIYYPLSMLILGGIREILIITTPHDQPQFKKLLGDGSHIGLEISYAEQPKPEGLAQAFIIGEDFIQNDNVCLILGDNIFYGDFDFFRDAIADFDHGAAIFGYWVRNPQRYGVVEFDKAGNVVSLEEKPAQPKSNYAVPGLYLYDHTVVARAKNLKPSARGELEITDLNRVYLEDNQLLVQIMDRGIAWLDAGTPQALLESNSFIGAIEIRQGLKIGCIEEASLRMGFITPQQLQETLSHYPQCDYRTYIERVIQEYE